MQEQKQTRPSTFNVGDIVTTYFSSLEWEIKNILIPCEKFPFVRYECQRLYGNNKAIVLFKAKELILVKKGDPK